MLEPIPFWGMIEVDIPVKTYAGNKGIQIQKLKCIVNDCQNHKHEGGFNGDVCSPCYQFIVHGKGTYSQAYRNTRPVELTDEEIMDYVDAFSIDMGNVYEFQPDNVLQMIRAILDKAQEK